MIAVTIVSVCTVGEEIQHNMFVFVVPFKGHACCSDWAIAAQLCARAISSMLAARSEIKVVLVCNEPPDRLPLDSRLIVKSVATPTPRNRHEMMEDKYFKIKLGLTLAREFAPMWVMRADADDLISRRLVPFIDQQRPYGAWYSETGWLHSYGSRWVIKQRNFHLQLWHLLRHICISLRVARFNGPAVG